MDPLRFTQLLVLVWLTSEIAVFLRDRQRGTGTRHDRGSRMLIFIGMTAAMWIAFGARARGLALLPGAPSL